MVLNLVMYTLMKSFSNQSEFVVRKPSVSLENTKYSPKMLHIEKNNTGNKVL